MAAPQSMEQWVSGFLAAAAAESDAARSAVARLETIAAESPQWFIEVPDDRPSPFRFHAPVGSSRTRSAA